MDHTCEIFEARFDRSHYGLYLDCTNRHLTTLPELNYDRFTYANFAMIYLHSLDVSAWKSTIFDLRNNPYLSCDDVIQAPGQIVYPCAPVYESDNSTYYYDDYSDHDNSTSHDRNDRPDLLALKILGWLVFTIVFVGLALFASIKIYLRRRKHRLGGELNMVL